MLSLKLLAHGKCHRRLIERLVCSIRLLDIVADTKQQEATLGLVKSDLTNDLIEALDK